MTLCIHLLCLPLARPTQYTYTAALPGSLRAPTDSSDTFCAPLSRPLARHKCFSDELDTAGGILFSLAELQKETTAGDNRWGPQLITRPPATKRTGRRRSPECSSRHPALLSLFSALLPAASECRTGTCFSRSFNSPPTPLSHSLPPSLRTCLIFLSFVSPASSTALPCKCWKNPKGTPPTQSPQAPSSPRHESIQRKLLPEPLLLLLLLLTRQPQGFIICLTIIFSYPPTASICKISTSPSFSGKCTPPTLLYNLSFTVNLSYKHVGSERSAE